MRHEINGRRIILLESLTVTGFRKYKTLTLKGLGCINFIMGSNNIGKTSILEAVYTWACGQNILPVISRTLSRGRYSGSLQSYWLMKEIIALFRDKISRPLVMTFDGMSNNASACFTHKVYISPSSAKWEVTCNGADPMTYDVSVPVQNLPEAESFCPARYIDILSYAEPSGSVGLYDSLKKNGLLAQAAHEMAEVFPDIAGFDMTEDTEGTAVSVIRTDGETLPLYTYGDGVQRWFHIIGSMMLYRDSVICIDEADTGFHPAVQHEFSRSLIRSAEKNNIQLFITTHNLEFIDTFLEASENFSKNISDSIKIITLREREDTPALRVLNASEAIEARDKFSLELR